MTNLFNSWDKLEEWEKGVLVFSVSLLFIILFSKCHGDVAILH